MKKAQIHIMETTAVLAVFFILIILIFVFYSNIYESNIKMEKEQNAQLNAINIAQKAYFLPELQCSQDNVAIENCIDMLKLSTMSDITKENEIPYFDMFSFSRITVNEIYPSNRKWDIYNKSLSEYLYKNDINMPMLLFDPSKNKNSFGVMNVEVFSR